MLPLIIQLDAEATQVRSKIQKDAGIWGGFESLFDNQQLNHKWQKVIDSFLCKSNIRAIK
jgi:flagellar biosynthesis/type III secretory pathway chaperone